MSEWAKQLLLEHSEWPIGFELKNLTVIAYRSTGPIRLKEMGSAENWMGYHVVTHLALQKLFRDRKRPVPGLLMFDQPTQAYYPSDLPMEFIAEDSSLQQLGDEDRQAVNRLYRLLFEVTEALAPNLQIIITDHADLNDDWFQQAVVARWRGGDKLVPQSWIPSDPTTPAI